MGGTLVVRWTLADLLDRAYRFSDEDRERIATAQREAQQSDPRLLAESRLRALSELQDAELADEYANALIALGMAYLPDAASKLALGEGDPNLTELSRWNEVASLTYDAMRDAALAFLLRERIGEGHLFRLTRGVAVLGSEPEPESQ